MIRPLYCHHDVTILPSYCHQHVMILPSYCYHHVMSWPSYCHHHIMILPSYCYCQVMILPLYCHYHVIVFIFPPSRHDVAFIFPPSHHNITVTLRISRHDITVTLPPSRNHIFTSGSHSRIGKNKTKQNTPHFPHCHLFNIFTPKPSNHHPHTAQPSTTRHHHTIRLFCSLLSLPPSIHWEPDWAKKAFISNCSPTKYTVTRIKYRGRIFRVAIAKNFVLCF